MKLSIALLCCMPPLFASLIYWNHHHEAPDRRAIEQQITAMRAALHRNDAGAIQQLLSPELPRANQPGDILFFQTHLGTDPHLPEMTIKTNEATLTPHPQRHFGVLPGGNTMTMKKINGTWYFTYQISID